MAREAAFTYDGLPISSGGAHTLRTRGFPSGFDALRSFVQSVSVEISPIDSAIEVIAGEGVPASFSTPLISEFDARFLKRRTRSIGSYVGHEWTIDSDSIGALAQKLSMFNPLVEAGYAGPAVVIHVTWGLSLVDPLTREELPFQSKEDYLRFETGFQQYLGESSIYARISDKTTANLFLSLPFEETAAAAQYVARVVQPAFPARLSSKHWKMWRLTKAKDKYVGRKIAGLI